MATQTEPTTPAGELPLTPEEQNYLSHRDPPLMKKEKNLIERDSNSQRKGGFNEKDVFGQKTDERGV